MWVWPPFVSDAKKLSGNFHYGIKIDQGICLNFFSRTNIFGWHKTFKKGRELVENVPLAIRSSSSGGNYPRVGIRDVATIYGLIRHVLVNVFGRKCVTVRLIPKHFFARKTSRGDHKRDARKCCNTSKEFLLVMRREFMNMTSKLSNNLANRASKLIRN